MLYCYDCLSGGAVIASPLVLVRSSEAAETKYLAVDNLGSFQRTDQRTEFRVRAEKALKEVGVVWMCTES